MRIDWSSAEAALHLHFNRHGPLPVWWRDDDAIAPTAALDRLLSLAQAHNVPLTLAVIPDYASQELASRLEAAQNISVSTHGWRHKNHAPPHEKNAEFGAHRHLDVMAAEIQRGVRRVQALFGDRAGTVFTPPWNRISPQLSQQLDGLGVSVLSTYGDRRIGHTSVSAVNTHLDPIAWRAGKELLSPPHLVERLTDTIARRTCNQADPAEPLGLLTHHLVHTGEVWAFIEAWLAFCAKNSPAIQWHLISSASRSPGRRSLALPPGGVNGRGAR
jgi:peptidoglycan/xylan/chitin deacetylase (PgdA/CDA1 family)